ncbi:MAG: hypothetical protein V4508_09035 [Pseudomonadota bacterium]
MDSRQRGNDGSVEKLNCSQSGRQRFFQAGARAKKIAAGLEIENACGYRAGIFLFAYSIQLPNKFQKNRIDSSRCIKMGPQLPQCTNMA